MLSDNLQKVKYQLNAIQSADYTTFLPKNKLVIAQHNFCSQSIPKINSFLSVDNYLKRAILTVQIANVEQFGLKKPVTAANQLIFQVLTVINKNSLLLLDIVSEYLKSIDQACHNRFRWDVQKQKIDESYISIFAVGNLEDFIKQGE